MLKKNLPFLNWIPLAKQSWKEDLVAGLTGTIIVIPQAVAFAIIAGLPPIYGFYTAMVTPVVAALFGSSYHLISGPTTAISIVVYATISEFADPETQLQTYLNLTLVLTFVAGSIQLAMGFARMGKLVNFVSHSVVIGFTAGAGILIAFKQLQHFFGINLEPGSNFYQIIRGLIANIDQANWNVFIVASSTLIFALVIKNLWKPIARFYLLLSMIFGSFIAFMLGGTEVGIESVGELSAKLPSFSFPKMQFEDVRELSTGALTVALLGLIEAVAIARSIALSSGQRIDGNQEFKGQGLSNIVASMFSAYMGSGSFTRSGVNYQAGAKTPMSAIYAAAFLALFLVLFASLGVYLPKAAMGGIIFLVGYTLIDFHHIKQVFKSSGRELIVLMTTLVGTLVFELETALFAGIGLSLFFYLERTAKPNIAILGTTKKHRFINIIRNDEVKECPQMKIVRIDGSIYFGALEVVSEFFESLYQQDEVKHVLIVAKGVNFIDLAGANWLLYESERWKEKGGGIYFAGLKLVSQQILRKGGFKENIGPERFFSDKRQAISHLFRKFDQNTCSTCESRIFHECPSAS